MNRVVFLFILFISTTGNLSFSQNRYVDSLIEYTKTAKDDTHKLSVLTRVIEAISEDAVWAQYNDKLGPLAKKLMSSKDLKIREKATRHYSDYLNNKGYLSNNLGDITGALDYFHQSLKVQEFIGDKSGQSYSLNNLGHIFNTMNQYSKALEFYEKSLAIQTEIGDKHGQAQSVSNIGNIYDKTGNHKKALFYYFKGLNIRKSIRNKQGIGYSLQNIGIVYFNQKNYFSAEYYYTKSLEVRREINDAQGIAYSLNNLGQLYLEQGLISKALSYGLEALELSKKIGFPNNIAGSATLLEDVYLKEGKFNKAHEMLKLSVKMRDSINNDETHKNNVQKQFQYEFEKKEVISKAEQEKRELTYVAKAKQQDIIIFASIAGLLLCLIFGIFIYNRFKITQRQNVVIQEQKKVVEEQKHIVETHQKEVLDSINYAKRIQYALLAKEDLLKQNLKSHFILFKPKDIVSGDFYWATEHADNFYLAVCDSTGHGVPGAFMSLLSIGFLSEAIKEKNIQKPNEIFDYVRKRLIESINNEDQKDGFDGVLLRVSKNSKKVTYAAANNHPVIISDGVINHLDYNKMPVGKGERLSSFSEFEINLPVNATIYIYTDGYADQFGGPKGKKFKYKPLNEMLLAGSSFPINEQSELLSQKFDEWKGALEQVDDVCIIGIRF